MADYIYNPPDYNVEPDIQHTSLDELDELEIAQRQGVKVLNPDNNYPDELKKPLFVSAIPEPTQKVQEAPKPKKINELSIKSFISLISQSFLNMVDELMSFNLREDSLVDIFSKDTYRLLSIAIILISIAIFLAFFRE